VPNEFAGLPIWIRFYIFVYETYPFYDWVTEGILREKRSMVSGMLALLDFEIQVHLLHNPVVVAIPMNLRNGDFFYFYLVSI